MKKTLLVLLALLMGLLGCAAIPPLTHDQCNATKFPTAHEHELCVKAAEDYQTEQDELQDKRNIRRDKLIMYLNACDANASLVLVEVRRGSSRACLPNDRSKRKALKEYGYKYTHDNVCPRAFQQDFQCWNRMALQQAIRRLSGGF